MSTQISSSIPLVRSERSRFDRRKDEIVSAAAGLVNTHGLRNTTLALVAAEIGLNLKSLRYYFERKEDLVCAAFLQSIALHRTLVEEAVGIERFADRIRRFVSSYFALKAQVRCRERPEIVNFGDLRALTEPHLGIVAAAYVELFRLARKLFRRGEAPWTQGERNANTHFLISQLLWSVIWLDGYEPQDFPRVADRLSDILLNGIAQRTIPLPVISHMPTPFEDSDRLSQESFLRAATQLINDEGYRGASVDRISKSLRVTKGAFYHHNDTRDELVVACFERTFTIIRQAQDLAMTQEVDGLSHVIVASSSLISRQMRPEGSLLRTSALTSVGPLLRVDMERRLSLSTLRFADMLNDGLADGSVRICDMRIAAEAVTATINSAQELQRWVPTANDANAAHLYVTPLLYGLGNPVPDGLKVSEGLAL